MDWVFYGTPSPYWRCVLVLPWIWYPPVLLLKSTVRFCRLERQQECDQNGTVVVIQKKSLSHGVHAWSKGGSSRDLTKENVLQNFLDSKGLGKNLSELESPSASVYAAFLWCHCLAADAVEWPAPCAVEAVVIPCLEIWVRVGGVEKEIRLHGKRERTCVQVKEDESN